MKIVTCYKWVIDEADVKVDSKTGGLDFRDAAWKVSLYDKNSIEMAVSLVEEYGGECIAITFGSKAVSTSRKEVLSRGPNSGQAIISDDLVAVADPSVTANVLAAAIRRIDDVDLIVCGEGASDDYAQQVGPRLAAALGLPVAAYVTSVKPDGTKMIIERLVDEGIEVLNADGAVVVSVLGDCNTPRIPTLKQILGAGKKDFVELSLVDLDLEIDAITPRSQQISVKGNSQDRKRIQIEGDVESAADELVRHLIQDGLIG
jgi:electron transfer flavoprotein beta subunit